jgi:hypothetical protein
MREVDAEWIHYRLAIEHKILKYLERHPREAKGLCLALVGALCTHLETEQLQGWLLRLHLQFDAPKLARALMRPDARTNH